MKTFLELKGIYGGYKVDDASLHTLRHVASRNSYPATTGGRRTAPASYQRFDDLSA
jgi:hypothetical protein